MKSLNIVKFLTVFPVFCLLVSWFAFRLWKGSVGAFRSTGDLSEKNAPASVITRYAASIPSAALALWAFFLATLLNHFANTSTSGVIQVGGEFLQWPFWFVALTFFASGVGIQILGKPQTLVPPNLRTGGELD